MTLVDAKIGAALGCVRRRRMTRHADDDFVKFDAGNISH